MLCVTAVFSVMLLSHVGYSSWCFRRWHVVPRNCWSPSAHLLVLRDEEGSNGTGDHQGSSRHENRREHGGDRCGMAPVRVVGMRRNSSALAGGPQALLQPGLLTSCGDPYSSRGLALCCRPDGTDAAIYVSNVVEGGLEAVRTATMNETWNLLLRSPARAGFMW